MSGFFGTISKRECVADVFYGTDYHSHLGTKRAGMAFYNGKAFVRSIHSLENGYFRNKFEDELGKFAGSHSGIGIISDTDSQPITIHSHLGVYSVVTVGRIYNLDELSKELISKKVNFAELSGSGINPTELVATLINSADSFKEGIEVVQQ
ncbi:MAG: amidophosphoribosyltransferase, partial [Rikenellaceae bacterium]|nr:amidophosphoribosyltransferase [Rikenellaceae bacterium]